MKAPQPVLHTIEPVFDSQSRVLLLGTMPSPKSREAAFYYMHPQNRFWRVITGIFDRPRYESDQVPETITAKRQFLLDHRIALWDVLASCRIDGASDSSIRDAVPNDLGLILRQASIEGIYTTGKTAFALYNRLCRPVTDRDAICLPSPSGANCAVSMDALLHAYSTLLVSASALTDNVKNHDAEV